ncbi:uncharacterized protein DFL_002111 [Arthrobotrys flagrans]|uniref:FAD-binding PCMH-type domain-containing protein n=1 Tax=Arthrobotrys flagrans TaxID=97331 RepID=A0A437A9Y8_ARTFL|nr:hypothetical protein DFL_002111 [Arthrobotrys flagrans]
MVRLSTIALGLLYGLSNTLGVVADTTTLTDPAIDGAVAVGFPSVNITAILAEAESELGVNGTVTDNLPDDSYGTPGTTITARDLEKLQELRKRTFGRGVFGAIACLSLKILFPSKTAAVGSSNYNAWNNPSFWSATTYMTPTCVFRPANVDDVSLAMRLITLSQADFNVVGGGHSAIKGWANAEDGVLIILSGLTGVNVKSGYAEVGTGERWGNVFVVLDQHKLMALGGRMSTVGVPGLALGGGISYLTNQLGFVADQVKNFQVVLANGWIVNANANANTDLFRALKGGSSNFGIVTRVDIYTWPCPKGVYSGQLYFSDSRDYPKLFDLVYKYHTSGALTDTQTHLISAFVYVPIPGVGSMHMGAFTAFRNISASETNPGPGLALQEIVDLNPTTKNTSTLQVRPYGTQAIELGSGDVNGLRQDMRDFSVYADKQLYKDIFQIWNTTMIPKHGSKVGFMGTIAFQPITTVAVAAGVARGGNSLGLEGNTKTMAIINLTHQWVNAADDDAIIASLNDVLSRSIALAKSMNLYHQYFYLNYARKQDNPIGSYGTASVNRLKAASKFYDPRGVFQCRVPGGFKIPGLSSSC